MQRARRALPATALVLLAAVLPLVLGGYALSLFILIGIHATAALGLTLLMGQAGQVSLAQGAFCGIGAYGSAILAMRGGLPPALAMPLAVVGASIVAVAIGLPSLRLGGHHLALATLGFGVVLFFVFNEEASWTGGPSGLGGIPRLVPAGKASAADRAQAYVVWSACLAAVAAVRVLLGSRVGRAFRAVAASESAAAASGIHVARVKLVAFALAGALGAVAGALYAHWLTFVSPTAFGLDASVELLVMAVLGGLGSTLGAIVGAAAVTLLVEALRTVVQAIAPGATGWVEVVAFGLILVGVLLLLPEGLTGGLRRGWMRLTGRRRATEIEDRG